MRRARAGFCAESPDFYVWDEHAGEVIDSAEVYRHASDYRGERVFAYGIDEFDAVSHVSDAWLAFAESNGADDLVENRVLGASIWEFIAGEETRGVYQALFRWVRARRRAIELPFRGDSPGIARFMRLQIRPEDEKRALRLEVRLVREHHRVLLPIFDATLPRLESALGMCSLCKRCCIEGVWLEPTRAALRLELLDAHEVPALEYRICEDCSERVETELRHTGHGRTGPRSSGHRDAAPRG